MARTRGQVTVEAVFTLPFLVVAVLCLLQLQVLQQASLMTRFAAWSAARAGAVWSGNVERMRDAALVALLPTLGRTEGPEAMARTWTEARKKDARLHELFAPASAPGVPRAFVDAGLLGMARVDVLSPADAARLGRLSDPERPGTWEELEHDGVFTDPAWLPASTAPGGSMERLQAEKREATLLRIRLRYLYELRVPLADALVFYGWFASRAGLRLLGPLERPKLPGSRPAARALVHEEGLPTVSDEELGLLWGLARGQHGPPRYFLPLQAEAARRMQSSFHRKWLMHEGDAQ